MIKVYDDNLYIVVNPFNFEAFLAIQNTSHINCDAAGT